jgi:hypothetical protein
MRNRRFCARDDERAVSNAADDKARELSVYNINALVVKLR